MTNNMFPLTFLHGLQSSLNPSENHMFLI